MPLRVRFHPYLTGKIRRWQLPDDILVDVWMRLRDLVEESQPLSRLRRDREQSDGLVYRFRLYDPHNRLRSYLFSFDVVYTQDEESLIVENGSMLLSDGFF
jgi:hypothetical protein